jgi:hypothetical protein
MDEATFWDLIGSIHAASLERGDNEAALEPLRARLHEMDVAAINGFADRLAEALYALDTREHAARAGGDEDDFLEARCHVVARGRAHWERVRLAPSAMAETLDEECNILLYLAPDAWAERTGNDPSDYDHVTPVSYETGSNRARWR